MNKDVLFSSKSAEWETPQWLFDELNAEFNFNIDVCATAKNTKCSRFIDELRDSLRYPWHEWGTCWCNPPYGRQIGAWVKKAYEESKKGAIVVMLLPARTDTKYFHQYIWDKRKHRPKPGVQVRFLEGRLKFEGATNSAPFPSMIVVFGGINDGN